MERYLFCFVLFCFVFCLLFQLFWFFNLGFCGLIHNLLLLLPFFRYINILRFFIKKILTLWHLLAMKFFKMFLSTVEHLFRACFEVIFKVHSIKKL
jgi:hypothetical protein